MPASLSPKQPPGEPWRGQARAEEPNSSGPQQDQQLPSEIKLEISLFSPSSLPHTSLETDKKTEMPARLTHPLFSVLLFGAGFRRQGPLEAEMLLRKFPVNPRREVREGFLDSGELGVRG